ncbi:hypothetical protein [Acidovorax sp. SUPP3334]|uniref:hypothetical protein n=1 Tax=Acidovorax sp. SUPP3334 TaxID=2920881 RepID=UPI0023DE6280|nr:hypothetical protein [Acidovorax sp. SUPP3334]GKT22541.1 hypothetical protein AVHM3334_08770 [Acidovorax sp. SUPP3334]
MSTAAASPHISQLRQHLLDTLADLRDRDKPMEPDRARAVAQVASVLVDTAKVEVEYLKATGQERAGFLEEPPTATTAALPDGSPFPNGITAVTRHALK